MASDNIYYEDLDLNPILNSNGDVSTVKNGNSIKQAMTLLLNTPKGSRIFSPDYGCRIRGFLFEPFDESTAKQIGVEIQEAITNYENRIEIVNLQVTMDWKTYSYNIDILYRVINTQYVDNLTITLEKL